MLSLTIATPPDERAPKTIGENLMTISRALAFLVTLGSVAAAPAGAAPSADPLPGTPLSNSTT